MPKSLPDHREIIPFRAQPNNMFDTDPVGIAALKPVGDAQGSTLALAPAKEKALVPAARRQLIPNKGCYATLVAYIQPGWSSAA